jgi:hypothetical protein
MDIINSDIRPTDFFNNYVHPRKPCILSTHPTDWPCSITWGKIVELASESIVQVEERHQSHFGSSKTRKNMSIKELAKILPQGQHYLTTQYQNADEIENEDAFRLLSFCQPPLNKLLHEIPLLPKMMGNLVPQQMNLWTGFQKGEPASSGLHHDFHDNLYILVHGRKKITLFSPFDAKYLYTYGKIEKICKNGLIQYEKHLRDDGAYLADVANWKLQKAQQELEQCEEAGLDTTEAEERLDEAMDECLLYENPQGDDDNDSINDEEILKRKPPTKQISDASSKKSERSEPNSFSRIDVATLHESGPSKKFPLLAKANRMTVELKAGEALYIPAGWFHEVTSLGENDDGLHMAVNYWMCPPTTNNFENPYEDTYWKEQWMELKELVSEQTSN